MTEPRKLTQPDYEALRALCAGRAHDYSDQPYTYEHRRRGRWAYARGKGDLFVAVQDEASPFAVNPKDIDRHLAFKKNPDAVTTAGRLRAWVAGHSEVAVTRDCAYCRGSGEVDRYGLERDARHEVFESYKSLYSIDEIKRMETDGELDEEIEDEVEAGAGGDDAEDGGPCPHCRDGEITETVYLARFRRTIFDAGTLKLALGLPFIADADEVTIHAPNCRRPSYGDLSRRLYLVSPRWVISFRPERYSSYASREDGPPIPIEEIPDFMTVAEEHPPARVSPPAETAARPEKIVPAREKPATLPPSPPSSGPQAHTPAVKDGVGPRRRTPPSVSSSGLLPFGDD